MAKSYIERGQSREEAAIAAICNELDLSPERIPEHLFIVLAWVVHEIGIAQDRRAEEHAAARSRTPRSTR